jgi:hypothetical protein
VADPIAGFDVDKFRTNIHFVMNLGLPQDTADRPTFYFRPVKSYPSGTRVDSEGTPLDPRIEVTVTSPNPVQVPCAVEFEPTNSDTEGLVGTFRNTRATLTVLDVDYELIKDAIEVAIGRVRYNISYQSPPVGLGQATIYTLHCFPKTDGNAP